MEESRIQRMARLLSETWPARMAKDAWQAVKLPGDVYQGNVPITGEDGRTNPEVINRAADLAGILMGGTYGTAPAGKGELLLGSGPVRKPPALPMDEASRMRRRAELGYDTPVYHATRNQFDEFRPSEYYGASFLANTPDGAVRGSQNGATHIMPLVVKGDEIAGLSLTPTEKKWWASLPDRASEQELDGIMKSQPHNGNFDYWWRVYDEVQQPDGSYVYKKMGPPRITLEDANKTGKDVYGREFAHWGGERSASRSAKDAGMAGFTQQDEAGVSIGLVDPSKVRSQFAVFDPANEGNGFLLGAGATDKRTAAILAGTGANKDRPTPVDDSIVEILKKYGLAGLLPTAGMGLPPVQQQYE